MLTVCIVEDQRDIREALALVVEAAAGLRLLGTFSNGEDALRGLPRLAPALTVMDIGLPEMSGTACIAHLADGNYRGDFLMFTVFEHDEHLFGALELGARGYILKGEGPGGVLAAIEEYRAGGAPMSRPIAQRVLDSFSVRTRRVRPLAFEALTPQENTVLELVADGLLNKEVAARLAIAEATVKRHNVNIYRKLSVNNRAEAVRAYLTRE